MRSIICLGLSAAILTLSGCASPWDPFGRPGQWSATNASNETIAQQAAYKSDLIQGNAAEPGSSGIAAVAGVEKAMSGGSASGLQSAVSAGSSSSSGGGG